MRQEFGGEDGGELLLKGVVWASQPAALPPACSFPSKVQKPRSRAAAIVKDGNFRRSWVLILVKFQPW